MTKQVFQYAAGDIVGIIRHNQWGDVHLQGTFRVTKCNGAVCELERCSDGYVRTFSNRTGIERSRFGTYTKYDTALIVSLDQYQSLERAQAHAAAIRDLWRELSTATAARDLQHCQRLLAELQQLTTP